MNSNLIVTGVLDIILYDKNYNVKETRHVKNKIVNTGLMYITARLTNSNIPDQIGYMALGTGVLDPSAGNIGLGTESPTNIGTRVPTSGATGSTVLSTELPKITYSATFAPGNYTASITEAGLFNSASYNQGTMLCRTTFTQVVKAAEDTMGIAWSIIFSAP